MHELSNIETRVPVFENERCCLLTGSRRYYRDTCRAGIGTKLREGRHIIGFGCQSSALQKKGDSMMALDFLQAPWIRRRSHKNVISRAFAPIARGHSATGSWQ